MTLLNLYETIFDFHAIRTWFNQHKRILPWRMTDDPYKIWISEVMLQQTQVDVVLPYYKRWIELFPTVESLATAQEEVVLKAWEGLGYYSRAKNLIKGAKLLLEKHHGTLPQTREELEKIPGIGDYTAGAIISFAFKKRAVALDGNVMRVLARVLGVEEAVDLPKTKKILKDYLETHLPQEKPYEIMEGLIELGALVCRKKPICIGCPLQSTCRAKLASKEHLLPIKLKNSATKDLFYHCLIFVYQDQLLITKKQKGEWNEGLYEFMTIQVDEPFEGSSLNQIIKYQNQIERTLKMKSLQASITSHRLKIQPHLVYLKDKIEDLKGEWLPFEKVVQLPKSSAHQKIMNDLKLLFFKDQNLYL